MQKTRRTIWVAVSMLAAFISLTANAEKSANSQFEALLDAHWNEQLAQNPTFATSLGVRDYDQQLSDPSLDSYQQGIASAQQFYQQLKAIDPAQLSEAHQVNHALLKLDLEDTIAGAEHGGKYMLITNRGGPHMNLTQLPSRLPFFKQADYESYLARLNAVPEYMDKATARIRTGLQAGWVQPCITMQGYEDSISAHLPESVNDSVFLAPFKQKPNVIDQATFDAFKATAQATVSSKVLPAFRKFESFYLKEYAPKCRSQVGTDSMPGGKAYYDYRVKRYTTTEQTANDIHKIGLSEVTRIKAEMMDVIKQAEFDGSFEEWLVYLRDNPDFYPKTAEERMQVAATISKRMDGLLPKLFGKLPRMPYGLKEIPLDIAEKTTTAYYNRPAGDGTRAGFYFVNTTLLNTRPLYQLEALSLHEAVPGHHLQIALAQELDLPNFRRYGGQTVFVEGWGLYAERLGLEVGFYQTPYTNFGRLSYEMWRACRLVVDTGIHSKGWSRQQAIDYMAENSGLSMNNITSEVDRYISWPGQALAYKTGELKIRELRARAESALGNQFDIRAFHDKVLENGAIPLSLLERIIDAWIKEQVSRLS
ncbi:DUF885 domain-containing protein [Arenicella xantha]|uniref:Uncharacterized protein (DUF885 family) n=1 Tax=Arenicella xantha TaxID=644221 RepID=A0A395JRW6_9GAMM|nr:DUF885 domain-containing protein [Arenicella xantha]RBP53186.1 uncharacterized protein (DUF885 family) [Arenicella xantha]